MPEDKYKEYPKTEMYQIIDTLGIPHSYCIGPKHVQYASKHCNGILGSGAISELEKEKGKGCCMVKGCNLTHAEHELALVVEVAFDGELNEAPGLTEYLKSCVPLMDKDKVSGFAFKKKAGIHESNPSTEDSN